MNKDVNLMANQKQLVLLSSGKTFWDKWRRTYPDVQAFEPDLHSADLHSADLHSADLHGADLTEANLRGADLDGAILSKANFYEANLSSEELSAVDLSKHLDAKKQRSTPVTLGGNTAA